MTSTRNYMRVRDKRVAEAKERYHRKKYKTKRTPAHIGKVAAALGVTPNQARAIMGLPYRIRRRIKGGKRESIKSAIYAVESVADKFRPRRDKAPGAVLPSRRIRGKDAQTWQTITDQA